MMQPLKTAGAIALKRVAPLFLAAVYEVGNIYKNLINYAKGGKDAVTKGSSGGGSRAGQQKERIVETKQTQEACWQKMKDSGEWVYQPGYSKPTLRNKTTDQMAQKSVEKWDIEIFNAREDHIGVIRPSEGFLRKEFAVKGRRMQK
jgi:hypothetical protein